MRMTEWLRIMGVLVMLYLPGCAQDLRRPGAELRPLPEVATQVGDETRWVKPGGDPCKPPVCTLESALARSGLSVELQKKFLELVRTTQPHKVLIEVGWRGWSVWGSEELKVSQNVVAAFHDGKPQPADAWEWGVDRLLRFDICGNWGGDKRGSGTTMRVGGIPQAYCNRK